MVGYKDMIPFTAERFDAEEWADLFAKVGAKFMRAGRHPSRQFCDVGFVGHALEQCRDGRGAA